VFPSIVVLAKPRQGASPPTPRVSVISRDEVRLDDLGRQVEDEGFDVPRARLGAEPWALEPPGAEALMRKIRERGVPLVEYAETKPYRGVLTGLNEASWWTHRRETDSFRRTHAQPSFSSPTSAARTWVVGERSGTGSG